MADGKGMAVDNKKTGVIVKDSTMTKKIDPQNNVFVDRENEMKAPELNNELWKERMFKIHNREFILRYADPSGGAAHSEKGYEIRENGNSVDKIELEEGIIVSLEEPVSILETHTGAEAAGESSDLAGSVYLMSPAGEMSFDLSKIKGMEGMKAAESVDADGNPMVSLGMFQIVMNFNADGKMAYGVEISAYLRDSLKVETENGQKRLELVQGEYQKPTVGNGVLKFADSYVNTKKGKVNVSQMTELHFQEGKETEHKNDSERGKTKESYHYNAFASTEVQIQNVKDNNEDLKADSAKTKIFGFPVELENVSINDSTGIMNVGKANLMWDNIALELEKIQLKEKHKKVKKINVYKKSKNNKEVLSMSVMNRTAEMDAMEAEGAIRTEIEEMEAEDGMGMESALLKLGNIEVKLQNVHINEESLEAKSAQMQYNHKNLELSDTKLQKGSKTVEAENGITQYEGKQLDLSNVKVNDSLQAKMVSLNLGDEKSRLKEEKQVKVEITENITAPAGEIKLHQHTLSMHGVKLKKELELSSLTASTEINNFFTVMTGFKYKEGGEAVYDEGTVMSKLQSGKKEDSKDKKSKESKIEKEQQYWLFTLGQGKYTGEFEDGIKSTGYLATGDIRKTTVKEGKITEDSSKTEKEEKISLKIKVLQYLKKMREEKKDKKKKKAPKIKTKERPQEILPKDIYTLDGFAKIENAVFEFEKDEKEAKVIGEGNVKVQDIPTQYYINDVLKKPKIAFAPEDAVEGVEFTIDSRGNLNATFENDAEVELNLKGIMGKENSEESTTYTITLGDLSIENGYLKARSASLERGIGLEQEGFEEDDDPLQMTEKAKKFLGCELTGSIVNEGEENGVELTEEGIKAHLGKAKLGKFGISGFMGFLSGEVDFRGGEIMVSAEKSYEPDKLQESFFKVGDKTPGLDASVPTPIPGLGVEFSITPSVGIGGAVGLGVNLGTPFDEYKKDSLELSGIIEGEGHAGITAGAGVSLGAGYIANIDLKLEGSLTASISGELKGSTAFTFIKDNNSKKKTKMQQSKDFNFDGFLKGDLTGALNFNSSVKFLFWKKQLFNIELWKKELGKLEIKGAGKKAKDKKGLIEGWELTSGEFNASWFSKEITKQYFREDYQGEEISTEEFKTLVAGCGEEAQNAWAVLCKLQAQKADTAIILSKEDKEALEARIEEAKREVKFKSTRYLLVLSFRENDLKKQLMAADEELKKEKKIAEEYAQKQGLAKDIFEKAEWGGFKKEKYQHEVLPDKIKEEDYPGLDNEKGKTHGQARSAYNKAVKERNAKVKEIEELNASKDANAAIDLMITYMLGQVSNQHIDRINEKIFLVLHDDLKQKDEEYAAGFYRENTNFLENYLKEFEDQNNYYDVLRQQAVYEKDILAQTREWDHKTYKFKRDISVFPKKLREVINKNPTITMKEVLQHMVKGDFTPKEKLETLKKAFGIQATSKDSIITDNSWIRQRGAGLKQGLFKATGNLFETIFSETEDSVDASTNKQKKAKMLEEVVKGKSVFDIFQKKEELDQNVVKAAAAVETAQKKVNSIKSDKELVTGEITEYAQKLELVKTKASEAVVHKNFNADAAKKAITLYSENYVEKMKGDNMQKSLEKMIKENKTKGNNALPKSAGKPL